MDDKDEAAKRRELRRKKILENSEKRLNKLLGYDKIDQTHDTSRSANSSGYPMTTEPSRRVLQTPLLSTEQNPAVSTTSSITSSRAVNPGENHLAHLFENTLQKQQASLETNKRLSSETFATVRLIFTGITAVLVRLMLCLEESSFFQQRIVYPFIILQCFFISYDFLFVDQKPSGIFSQILQTVATLSSASSIAEKVANLITEATKVFVDLTAYLFMFVILHYCLETFKVQV